MLPKDELHSGEAERPHRKPQGHGREGRRGQDRESRKTQVICRGREGIIRNGERRELEREDKEIEGEERKEEGNRRKGESGRGRERRGGEYLKIWVKIHRLREVCDGEVK